MSSHSNSDHWDTVYLCGVADEVSWYQAKPEFSLNVLHDCVPLRDAKIIDIGGGDSLLVDYLLDMGYMDVTVLDISACALDKAKQRLGARASLPRWMVQDAARFTPTEQYDFWHDRATFHFLTDAGDIEQYVSAMRSAVKPGGTALIGTFSEQGPAKCSGLEVRRYSEQSMTEVMAQGFEKQFCISTDHITPKGVRQNFVFCLFMRSI